MHTGSETLDRWTEQITLDRERARAWAKRNLTRDRFTDFALSISALSITGLIVLCLYRAVERGTLVSAPPF